MKKNKFNLIDWLTLIGAMLIITGIWLVAMYFYLRTQWWWRW